MSFKLRVVLCKAMNFDQDQQPSHSTSSYACANSNAKQYQPSLVHTDAEYSVTQTLMKLPIACVDDHALISQ